MTTKKEETKTTIEAKLDKDVNTVTENCKSILAILQTHNAAFCEEVKKQTPHYVQELKIMKGPTNHHNAYESTVFTKGYDLILKAHDLCTVTSNALPPPISKASHPDHYKHMTVVRTLVWIYNIIEKGKEGFFIRSGESKEAKKYGRSEILPVEKDPKATMKDIRGYIEDCADNYDFALSADVDDFIDVCFNPKPVWWDEKVLKHVKVTYRARAKEYE